MFNPSLSYPWKPAHVGTAAGVGIIDALLLMVLVMLMMLVLMLLLLLILLLLLVMMLLLAGDRNDCEMPV